MTDKMISLTEAISVFGNAEVKFNGYYKYTFTFTGMFGEKELSISVGGNSTDIYRLEVTDQPVTAESLMRRFFDESVEVQETDHAVKLWSAA